MNIKQRNTLTAVYSILMLGMGVMLIPMLLGLKLVGTGALIAGFIGILVLVVAIQFTDSRPLSTAMFFGITSIFGMLLYPVLFMSGIPVGTILTAAILTFALFAILSGYVLFTGKDFANIGGFLIVALLLLIVAGIINIFVKSAMFDLFLAWITIVIFSGFVLYDTSNIINGPERTPAQHALSLFLDIINIFMSILRILKD